MADPGVETYRHTQKGPWGLVCYALAAAALTASWYMPAPALQITFFVTALSLILLGASLGDLTVEDQGDRLAVRFGPIPLLRRRILYDDVREVKQARTTFLEGWGIHWSPWGGWVWNIWSYDCVALRLKRGKLKIGTDDPDALAELLNSRMANRGGGHATNR